VQDALDARELRRLTVSEGRSAELNSPAPQVRTCMILYGDETFRDAKNKEVVK
jgi:hypothetical protein